MSTYCSTTDIKNEIDDFDEFDFFQTRTTWLSGRITRRSAYIDSYLDNYESFPDVTDSPATPELIRDICTKLVVVDVLIKIEQLRRSTGDLPEIITVYKDEVKDMLDDIKKGDTIIIESETGETLTYGDGDPLDDQQAFITQPHPFPDTVKIVGYETEYVNGVDYRVYTEGFKYNKRWIFHRFTADITTSMQISYKYTYSRDPEARVEYDESHLRIAG